MPRALVIDDKEENRYLLQALLAGHGWQVDVASHGAEALLKARNAPPDVVVSDLLMPVMDGYTLLRHWKADERLRRAPFVVYTATYTDPADEKLALDLGADAFILKPTEPEEFMGRLRSALDRRSAAAPASPPAATPPEVEASYSATLVRKLEEKSLGLAEANRRLREQAELLDAAHDAIYAVDLEGRVRYWNGGAERLYGWTAAEALGRPSAELVVDDAGRLADALPRLREQGLWLGEVERRTRDGRAIVVQVRWTLVRDQDGRPRSILAIDLDITERRRLEEQVLRAQRMESIGTLAGGIAHDLNNILSPILISTDLLRGAEQDTGRRELLQAIRDNTLRGAELIRQILSFARGVQGRRQRLDPGHLARDLQRLVMDTFPKDIAVELVAPPDLWTVTADATQLHQVLMNLVVNARDAMPGGGRLTVELSNEALEVVPPRSPPEARPGRYVRIDVRDTGAGIAPEHLPRVFELFFTTKAGGTGLGLATVQTIVKGHGGFVSLQTAAGRGTTFTVRLPADPPEPVIGAAGGEAPGLAPGKGELLLIVDDEEGIRTAAKRTLEQFGYRVAVAADGAAALAHERLGEVALVITDMSMPSKDGAALVAALRARRPGVRVVLSSGQGDPGSLARALATGVQHFLPKPYGAAALLRTVRQALDAP